MSDVGRQTSICGLGIMLLLLASLGGCYFERPIDPDRRPPELWGNIAGQVIDSASHQPIEGAYVFVFGWRADALTDYQGNFKIDHLPASPYRVRVYHVSHTPYTFDQVIVKPNKTSELKAAMAPGPTYGQIKGRVIDSLTGEPVPTATILLVGTRLGAVCDHNGAFEVTRVPAGPYTVRASSVGYYSKEFQKILADPELTIRLDVELMMNLTPIDVSH